MTNLRRCQFISITGQPRPLNAAFLLPFRPTNAEDYLRLQTKKKFIELFRRLLVEKEAEDEVVEEEWDAEDSFEDWMALELFCEDDNLDEKAIE